MNNRPDYGPGPYIIVALFVALALVVAVKAPDGEPMADCHATDSCQYFTTNR